MSKIIVSTLHHKQLCCRHEGGEPVVIATRGRANHAVVVGFTKTGERWWAGGKAPGITNPDRPSLHQAPYGNDKVDIDGKEYTSRNQPMIWPS